MHNYSNLLLTALITIVPFGFSRADEVDPRRPAAIQTEGVPIVPAEVFERLAQYQNIRAAGFSGWSPDGRGILVRTRFGNSSQLHRVHEPGGRREQITFFDEPVRGRFIPQAQDGAILLSISLGGNENYQIHLLNRKDFKTTRLTDGKSRNGMGPILDDGSKMIISSNKRNGRDTDLYVADPRKPNSMKIVFPTNRQYWYAADWTPDGATLLLGRYVSINESYWALLDVATGKLTNRELPGGKTGAIGA